MGKQTINIDLGKLFKMIANAIKDYNGKNAVYIVKGLSIVLLYLDYNEYTEFINKLSIKKIS